MRPLDNHEIEDEHITERFAHYQKTRGFTPNSIRTMARRPNIVKAFMALNQTVLYEGTVDEQLKMLVSLISSVASGCLYCQSHMTNLSHLYAAPDEKIADILRYEESPHFSAAERAALDLAYKAAQVPNAVTQREFDERGRSSRSWPPWRCSATSTAGTTPWPPCSSRYPASERVGSSARASTGLLGSTATPRCEPLRWRRLNPRTRRPTPSSVRLVGAG